MTNKLLHALTNRNGPFQEPMFVGWPEFVPAVIQAPEQRLRELMMLHVTTTDYYVKAYLSCIEAYPDIKELADDTITSYVMTDFPPRGVEMSGGDFLSKANSIGYYNDVAAFSFPVVLTYRVSYLDSLNVKVEGVETGIVRVIPYTKSGTAPNETLRIEWPDDIPFHGPLSLSLTWLEGAMVEINVSPSAFPYALVAHRIQGNPWLMRLLIKNQFVDEYVSVPDPQRKVALAAMVLALSNTSVYPS